MRRRLFANRYFPLVLVLILTFFSHGINLFGYPYFEDDEGTYASQAWWTVEYGQFSPYTYTYDHFPFGWMQIGAWQILTGGPFTFGFSLFSGRIFMLLVSLAANVLVYAIVYKLTNKRWAGIAAVGLLVLSPLSIYFHRRLLLDNIQNLWFLVSIWLLVNSKSRLGWITLSAVAFGLSIWSKELALVYFPAMVLGVYMTGHKANRVFGVVAWIVTVMFFTLSIPGLALLKGEFFPVGWFGDNSERVSMVTTWMGNLNRGTDVSIWNTESPFRQAITSWWFLDPLAVVLGLWVLVSVWFSRTKDNWGKVIFLMGISFVLFAVRGALLLNFYIIPFVSILAISLGLVVSRMEEFYSSMARKGLIKTAGIFLMIFLLGYYGWQGRYLYFRNETRNQLLAYAYVKKNVSPSASVIIDDYALLDMKHETTEGPAFPNAEWFSKVERDPQIKHDKFRGRWQNFDFIMLSHEMLSQMGQGEFPFLRTIYHNSDLVEDFPSRIGTYRDFSRMVSTNGDWASLMVVKAPLGSKDFESRVSKLIDPAARAAAQRVINQMKSMTLKQKVGQMVWMSISKPDLDRTTAEFLVNNSIGGVILTAKSIESPEQLKELITDIKNAYRQQGEVTPFIAVDQEGGNVSRIPFDPTAQVSQSDMETIEEVTDVSARRGVFLADLGVNVNLAPVLDIYAQVDSFVGRKFRTFGEDPLEVSDFGSVMIGEYEKRKVLSVAKHFPGGLGYVSADPHIDRVVIQNGEEIYLQGKLPYERILGQLESVMIDNLVYEDIDIFSASISHRIITERLRGELGFEGLVITDDILMESVGVDSVSEAGKKAVFAGVDVVLAATDDERIEELLVGIYDTVSKTEITEERINQSLERILTLKEKYIGLQ
jgi:beta-glucosidase-like glycosyl hydrolase/4-amino-4-deoxy-L-arabinose transferase-like glycosyltransferase